MTNIRAIRDKILVSHIERGERKTAGGLVLVDDDGKNHGIRPRWAKIYSMGEDVKDDELAPGKWILIEHGKWTRKMEIDVDGEKIILWGVKWPDTILAVSDDQPVEYADRY